MLAASLKLHMQLPDDPAIFLFRLHPKEMKTSIHAYSCLQAFVAALFRIAKNQKQLTG